MRAYSFAHLSDPDLRRDMASAIRRECGDTATVLAYIAEFDARRLYLPDGYPSMYAYCVGELHLSEDAAYKRIQAARVCREFPILFEAVAEGRLHLSAVVLLAPHLTPGNVDGLLAAATHRTKSQIEAILRERFPSTEAMTLVTALPGPELSVPGRIEMGGELSAPGRIEAGLDGGASAGQLAPGQVGPRSKLTPVAPGRSLLQVMIGRSTQEKLRYVQDLLGHSLPSGDLAQLLDGALDAFIEKLERRKFAATGRPRQSQGPSASPRHVPAQVKRAVWERDGGQCTFVSESGHRCPARKRLEFDHVQEVARGGRATEANLRLRCRAHNLYTADCTFGAGFMREKREEARRSAETRRRECEARAARETGRRAEEAQEAQRMAARAAAEEVITPLRLLGFSAEEARRAAAQCENTPEVSLEQRLRNALAYLRPRSLTPATSGRGGAP